MLSRLMRFSPLEGFQAAALGATCVIELNENGWAIGFTRSGRRVCTITVESLWRLVRVGQVIVTSADHGQPFGFAAPVNAEERSGREVADKPVRELSVDRETGDLTIAFGGDARIEVLTTSSGYENWQAYFESGGEEVVLVAGGGGNLSWASGPTGSKSQVLSMRPLH